MRRIRVLVGITLVAGLLGGCGSAQALCELGANFSAKVDEIGGKLASARNSEELAALQPEVDKLVTQAEKIVDSAPRIFHDTANEFTDRLRQLRDQVGAGDLEAVQAGDAMHSETTAQFFGYLQRVCDSK
ncbi:hypothetical protein [Buchananella hordeovulneris]|uniref:hypothetical protein n=1 Tax=Buchananella hordeovulneris TaxID=52770 RepID=UPI0026DD728A|nr:hypothetical protein [Buchananella hordeovulneris]MDO5079995.1 hypothetical protein [Buchananella hordeovulneris]